MPDAITAISIMTAQGWIVEIEALRDGERQVSVYDPDGAIGAVSVFHGLGDSVEAAISAAYQEWRTPNGKGAD